MVRTVVSFVVYAFAYACLGWFLLYLAGPWRGRTEYEALDYALALAVGYAVAWSVLLLARAVRRVGRVPVGEQHLGDGGHGAHDPG